MAKYKRWFPVSHEINHDPDVLEFKAKFGLAGFSLWLEILSQLDKNDNEFLLTQKWLESCCKMFGCRFPRGWLALNQMLANDWLRSSKVLTKPLPSANQTLTNGFLVPTQDLTNMFPMAIMSPKYAEYHRIRSPKSDKFAPEAGQIGVPPNLPNLPNLPNPPKVKEKEYKNTLKRKVGVDKKTSWPSGFELNEELRQYALNQGIKRPEEEFENFQLKATAKGYQYKDWNAAWKSWCRSEFQKASKEEKIQYI